MWFPRFNPSGSQIIWEAPGKWQAQWLDESTPIWQDGVALVIGGVATKSPPCNELSAGGGKWAGWFNGTIYTSWGQEIPGAGGAALSASGRFAYVDDRQSDDKNLIVDGVAVAHGPISDVRRLDQCVVWSEGPHTFGFDGTRVALSVLEEEFRPIPVATPSGVWVLNHTHTGIILRPWGDVHGYRFDNGGETYYPDAIYRDGAIRVVFSNSQGVEARQDFVLSAPRLDLRQRNPPLDPPPPPPIRTPMRLPRPVWNHLNAVRATFPSDRALSIREIGAILNLTALPFGGKVGMQSKPGGTHAELQDGTPVWNGLRFIDEEGKHWGVDCCGACSVGRFDPVDADAGEAEPGLFVKPIGTPIPPVDPTDPPPSGDIAALTQRVEELENAPAPNLTSYAKKGGPVTVKVPYLGTAKGSIDKDTI